MILIKRIVTIWNRHDRVSQYELHGTCIAEIQDHIIKIFQSFDPDLVNLITIEMDGDIKSRSMCVSYRVFDGVLRRIAGSSTSWQLVYNLTNSDPNPPKYVRDAPELYEKLNNLRVPKKDRLCKECGEKIQTQELWLICQDCHTHNQQYHHTACTFYDPLVENKYTMHCSPTTPKRRA